MLLVWILWYINGKIKNNMSEKDNTEKQENGNGTVRSRRSALKMLAGIPVLGYFSYELWQKNSFEKNMGTRLIEELGLGDSKVVSNVGPVNGKLLRLGIVGFGIRAGQLAKALGFVHPDDIVSMKKMGTLEGWLQQDSLNVAVTGICDVFDLHAEKGIQTAENTLVAGGVKHSGLPVKRYRTYQEMLADDSIDGVIIATPDHHHARMSIDAIKAGKHVYCEKSVSLSEGELHELYATIKNSDRVFQLGHQITQNVVFQQAREIIAKDILGKVTMINTNANRNTASGAWIRHLDAEGNLKPGSPETIDWEQWLGNAPKVPFSVERFYSWAQFFDYDTGMLGQLFSHEYDAVNQLLKVGIPHSAVTSGGTYYWKDNRDVPDTINSVFEYPEKEMSLTFSAMLGSSHHRGRLFMGHDAMMSLEGDLSITADYASEKYKKKMESGLIDPNLPMLTVSPGSGAIDAVTSATEKYYASRGLTSTMINGRPVDVTHLHLKEWIECIHNGDEPSGNIDRAFEEGITILMAHKSYIEKRRVEWDPVNRKIV
jgi:predicted dehydrogenase